MLCPLLVALDGPDLAAAALRSGAEALVLDLGGADAPGDRGARRRAASDLLGTPRAVRRPWTAVRVAPLASGLVDGDLAALTGGVPDAVVLPGAAGRRDVEHLAAKLAVLEAEGGIAAGRIGVVAMAADTARGVLALPTLVGAGPRLRALAWDSGALAADLGVGTDASPVRAARDALLVAAAAAGVPALDGSELGVDLVAACRAAKRDGFAGHVVRRPRELTAVRGIFLPREA